MDTNVTKATLGRGYVVSAGVVLGLALLGHAVVALRTDPVAAAVAVAGLVPAAALASSSYWLPASGLEGEQMWSIAQWCGLGIALLTVLNVGVLVSGRPLAAMTPVLLATAVALGGATGLLIGALVELRSAARRLERGNGVLGRVIQHNLRNDLTVILGHLGELEREVPEDAQDRLERLATKVDHIVTTTDKARQIDVALATEDRPKRPVDVVGPLEDRLAAVERVHPGATVDADMPPRALVVGDWFVKTVLDNVVENALTHADGLPEFTVTVDRVGNEVIVRVVDDCPPLPENEQGVFGGTPETPLDHSTGVGLWLVRLVMESYGGEVRHEYNETGGNTIELRFRAAGAPDRLGPSHRLRRLLPG